MPTTNSSPRLHHETTVVRSAIQSRLLVLTLIFLWRTLLSPYDTSASINPNCLSTDPSQQNVLFPSLSSAIESSIVWDSVYFVRIAERRYEYEQTYAFFPLLPLCMSMLSRTVLAPLVPVIGQRAVLGLSGYVINNIGFVFAAVYLYRPWNQSFAKVTQNRDLKARNQVNKDGRALVSEEHTLSAKRGYLTVAVLPCILYLGFMAATAFLPRLLLVSYLSALPSIGLPRI